MPNSIQRIELRDHSLVPPEAEVHLTVVPSFVNTGTEVRARLMGPRCRFTSTVEVAYHFRPLLIPTAQPALTLRAIIPEASYWEPQTPHLYAGPVELWQDGQRSAVVQVRHGLRHLALGLRGLRLNGRLLRLRGRTVQTLDESSALALRQAGCNLVVVPVSDATRSAWEIADRIGLFVLGRLETGTSMPDDLAGHPSCLGWLDTAATGMLLLGSTAGRDRTMGQFRIVRANELAAMPADLPMLALGPPGFDSEAAVLGVVEEPLPQPLP
jgi:hypothetical protein